MQQQELLVWLDGIRIIKCPCHEEGASKLIDWAKSDDGFSVIVQTSFDVWGSVY